MVKQLFDKIVFQLFCSFEQWCFKLKWINWIKPDYQVNPIFRIIKSAKNEFNSLGTFRISSKTLPKYKLTRLIGPFFLVRSTKY